MSTEPQDYAADDDATSPTRTSAADLTKAYAKLNADLGKSIQASAIQPILDRFRLDAGITKSVGQTMRSAIHQAMPKPEWEPPVLPDPVHRFAIENLPLEEIRPYDADIAESTERAAEIAKLQHEAIAQLVALTAESLQLAEAQRESADRTERFSRITTTASIVIAAASLAAAIVAIVVS